MTNIEEKIKNRCWKEGHIVHDLDMDNIITQLDTIKKKYNKNYNDIINECEIYCESDIGALVEDRIGIDIYPKPENPDWTITCRIDAQSCLMGLIEDNIIQYYITLRHQHLYLCKVIK